MGIIKLAEEQREQTQNDLLCILDGLDQDCLDRVCQVVCDRFNIVIDAVREEIRVDFIK